MLRYPARLGGFVLIALATSVSSVPSSGQTAPGQPHASFWHAANSHGRSILDWDPATDSNAAFNRASIPLATRIAPTNINGTAKVNQGGVTSLVAFNSTSNNASQGSATQRIYAPGHWQYMDNLVFWGGSATEGSILAPNATIIDAAHRNGVRVLGNVFLAPVVYGGNKPEVDAFLQQRQDGSFPVADKMIQAARHYGFDGWFLNQETDLTNTADATKMQNFMKYMRARAPELHIQWYDAMNESGDVGWQGALNSSNDAFFDTTASPDTGKVSDSMFLDFRWSASRLNSSGTHANSLGRSRYELFAGVDFESRGYGIASSVETILNDGGGNHRTSLGIYRPEYTFNHSSSSDIQDFYRRDEIFWSGQNRDPSNTTTTEAWKGIANYIPARSSISGHTFATNFSVGTGTRYMVDGEQLATGAWNNLSLQDVQPTYRWVVDSTGVSKLTPSFSHTDAFHGGTSLNIAGTLDGTNDVKLYQTQIAVAGDTKFKLVYKPTTADPRMKVAIAFADAPNTYVYFDVGAGKTANDWNTTLLDLGAHAGKTISEIGLRFGEGVTTPIANYATRLGQFVVYRGEQSTPSAPANVYADKLLAASKSAATIGNAPLPLRLHWTHSDETAYAYGVYHRLNNGSQRFVGGTPNNAYFVNNLTRVADENFVTLEFETIGLDFGTTRENQRTKMTFYVDWHRGPWTLDWQGNGANAGGGGTWATNALQWNAGPTAPVNQYWSSLRKDTPRFGGITGGTIDVAAPVTVSGMFFTTDGYTLRGSDITLGEFTAKFDVRPNVIARVENNLTGGAQLVKAGLGTLILAGDNAYTGGTRIQSGVLRLGSEGALPDEGDLVIAGGALDTNGFGDEVLQLTIVDEVTFQFGEARDAGNVLSVASVSDAGGSLLVTNWDGSLAGGAGDRFVFAHLADAERIARLTSFVDPASLTTGIYGSTVIETRDGRFEVVPVPEPATLVPTVATVAILLIRRR